SARTKPLRPWDSLVSPSPHLPWPALAPREETPASAAQPAPTPAAFSIAPPPPAPTPEALRPLQAIPTTPLPAPAPPRPEHRVPRRGPEQQARAHRPPHSVLPPTPPAMG